MKIRIELSKVRKEDEFAVCLTKAPKLPGKSAVFVENKFDCNLSVVACNDDNDCGGWGWCNLDSDEKEAIGQKLLDIDADLNVWYFCLMFKEADNES